MFAYFRGMLVEKSSFEVVLDVQGVGYKLYVPATLFAKLPAEGAEVKLFVCHVVREMSQLLYGFLEQQELKLFELLITLPGIGPKTALAIVGHFALAELEQIVLQEDSKALARVPGIGKKSAERLLVDLKGKLKVTVPLKEGGRSSTIQDALNALLNLGYTQSHAEQAVKKALAEQEAELDLPDLIAVALKQR